MRAFIEICLLVALVCAVCSGVTVNGKHYQIECSCDKGVTVSP